MKQPLDHVPVYKPRTATPWLWIVLGLLALFATLLTLVSVLSLRS